MMSSGTSNGTPGDPEARIEPGLLYRLLMILGVLPAGRLAFRVRVLGRSHLPGRGGALIAANHQSYLDIPLISFAAWERHVAYVARDSLDQNRLLSWIMRHCGTILIRRGTGDVSAIRAASEWLRAGDLVALFPEGTRTRDGSLGPFKKGAHLAARRAGVPILPCAIRGSFQAWPRHRRLPRPRRLEIEFAAPVDSAREDALERVRSAIAGMLAQIRMNPRGSEEPRVDETVP